MWPFCLWIQPKDRDSFLPVSPTKETWHLCLPFSTKLVKPLGHREGDMLLASLFYPRKSHWFLVSIIEEWFLCFLTSWLPGLSVPCKVEWFLCLSASTKEAWFLWMLLRWHRLSACQYLTRRHNLFACQEPMASVRTHGLCENSWPLYSPILARMSVTVTDLRCRAVLWVTEALIHQGHGLINHPYAGNNSLSLSWKRST